MSIIYAERRPVTIIFFMETYTLGTDFKYISSAVALVNKTFKF